LHFLGKHRTLIFQEDIMRSSPTQRRPGQDHKPAAVVVSKAVVRSATILGLTNAGLAKVLGLSPATASRLRDGAYFLPFDSKPYELALLLIRLFRGLDAMMGGEEPSTQSWMRTQNLALGSAPIDRISSVTGLVEAVAYVDAARARV
jgi:hypothetical protein